MSGGMKLIFCIWLDKHKYFQFDSVLPYWYCQSRLDKPKVFPNMESPLCQDRIEL